MIKLIFKKKSVSATVTVSPVSLRFLLRYSAKVERALCLKVAKWMCKISDLSSLARLVFPNYSYNNEQYEDHCMLFSMIFQNITKVF